MPYIQVTGVYTMMRLEGQDVRVFKADDGKIYLTDDALSGNGLSDGVNPYGSFGKTFTPGGGLRPETFAGYPLLGPCLPTK